MPNNLMDAEVEFYKANGYLKVDRPVFSKTRFEDLRRLCQGLIKPSDFKGETSQYYLINSVPDFLDFAIEEDILDMVESLVGSDIGLWGATAFIKNANSKTDFKWHSDFNQIEQWEEIAKIKTVNMLIAVSDSTLESGCVQYAPATHLRKTKRKLFSMTGAAHGQHEERVDLSGGLVSVELRANTCSFHDAHIMHRSEPNKSNYNRILISLWYFSTDVDDISHSARDYLKKASVGRVHLRGEDKNKTCAHSILRRANV